MISKDFNHTIDSWIKELEKRDFIKICTKPSPTCWSLDQVCMHLIEANNYFLEQAAICLATNDNVMKEMTSDARTMFQNNEFPDKIIQGPSNNDTPQPESKEKLLKDLLKLKTQINSVENLISASSLKGKSKHPGLGYFNAREWLQFAYMHLRHHARQKRRIEAFLNETSL